MAKCNFSYPLIGLIAILTHHITNGAIIPQGDHDSSMSSSLTCDCPSDLRGGSNIAAAPRSSSENTNHDGSNINRVNSRINKGAGDMDCKSIAVALKFTSILNRRLDCAAKAASSGLYYQYNKISNVPGQTGASVLDSHSYEDFLEQQPEQYHRQRQYQFTNPSSNLVNVHPSQTWQPPLREGSVGVSHNHQGTFIPLDKRISTESCTTEDIDSTTIFDTSEEKRTDLADHIQRIHATINHGQKIPALAFILMDRASSVDIMHVHSYNSQRKHRTPYITPATVHKLYLTAMILATRILSNELLPRLYELDNMYNGAFNENYASEISKIFNDETNKNYANMLTNSGIDITPHDLAEMTEWMYSSLGADGVIVYPSEVDHMLKCWKCLFTREAKSDEFKCEIDQNNVGGDALTQRRPEVSRGTNTGHFGQKILDNEIHNNYPQQRQYPLEGEAEGKHILQRG